MKLFCIPFSGGNIYSYAEFKKYLPEWIEFRPLELPGRGKRISEPLLYDIQSMTDDLFLQIENELNGSYAIWGHSLGGLLAYTLSVAISEKEKNLPVSLFISGHTAPKFLKAENQLDLPDDEFTDLLRKMEGTPEELLADDDFMSFFLPVIKADFNSISSFVYKPLVSKLKIPIAVFRGSEEDIEEAEVLCWKDETEREIFIRCFDGGHFFIFEHAREICSQIEGLCNKYLQT